MVKDIEKNKTNKIEKSKIGAMTENIIQEIDTYYISLAANMKKIFDVDNIQKYIIKFTKEDGNDIIELHEPSKDDPNKPKLVFKGLYDFIGVHDPSIRCWYWAWAIDYVSRNLSKKSKKVRKYCKALRKQFPKSAEIEKLYFYAKTNIFMITQQIVIDEMCKLMLYLNKGLWVFKVDFESDNVKMLKYVSLKKVLEIK